jgi:hypothetical protein
MPLIFSVIQRAGQRSLSAFIEYLAFFQNLGMEELPFSGKVFELLRRIHQ